jgi:hypothetical protein
MSFIKTIFKSLFGIALGSPVKNMGEILDNLFPTNEELISKQILLERLKQKPHLAQALINKIEAKHKSWWVSGWRPNLGWALGTGIWLALVINPLLEWFTHRAAPTMPLKFIFELTIGILGLYGSMRTLEKLKGKM